MKVLLVYPSFPQNGFWNYQEVCRLMGARYPAAPLGLITLAALLPQDWSMSLVDMNAEELTDEAILEADLVFSGGMLPQQTQLLKLIRRVHALGKKIVLGGPDPSSQPEIYREADFLVVGEAETVIPQFLEDLKASKEKGFYRCETHPEMKQSPVPRYDLLNFRHYLMVGVQFSRGCPFNCEFCDIIELYGRVPRTKSPEQILRELETLYALGYRGHIDFVDDNFIGHKEKVKEILHALILWSKERNFPFFFSTEASINLADDEELLGLMRELDFRYVFVGLESADPEVLKATQKYHNVHRKLKQDLLKFYQYGIVVNAGFILGLDSETREGARALFPVIQEGKIAMAMMGLLYALPNTQLTRRLEKEERMFNQSNTLDEDHESTTVDQTSSGLNFLTLRPREEIMEDYRYLLEQVYSVKNYFNRVLALGKVLSRKPAFKPSLKMKFRMAKAFFKLVSKMGLFSRRGVYFWRNIFILLFSRISSIETVVNLMAMHLHFAKQVKFIRKTIGDRMDHATEETRKETLPGDLIRLNQKV